MSGVPATRASDAERERTVALLRESAATGRLTLEEFTERMATAYASRTLAELDELVRDLSAAPARSRRKATRLVLALFGSTERGGRLRLRRSATCLMAFGNIDLDLRQATFDGDVVTVVALGAFGAIDLYVPEGVEVDLHGLSLFGHRNVHGDELTPQAGMPLVRVHAFSLFAGIDVWHVPRAWAERSFREVIRGIRGGRHRELTE